MRRKSILPWNIRNRSKSKDRATEQDKPFLFRGIKLPGQSSGRLSLNTSDKNGTDKNTSDKSIDKNSFDKNVSDKSIEKSNSDTKLGDTSKVGIAKALN